MWKPSSKTYLGSYGTPTIAPAAVVEYLGLNINL